MHDEIKRFEIDGVISDDLIVQTRERLINFMEWHMREDGFVPCLDLEPQFTLDYVPEDENYKFVLSVYGIHVGGTDAWDAAGMMNGKIIYRYITPPK